MYIYIHPSLYISIYTYIQREREREVDRQVFCLDYDRFFCDKELWLRGKELDVFHFDPDIKIQHLHPAFGGKEDQTHKNVRKYLNKDKQTYRIRQEKNLLWGRSYELINA